MHLSLSSPWTDAQPVRPYSQSQPYWLATSPILCRCSSPFAPLFQPFCAPIWAMLSCLPRHSNFPNLIPLPPSEITCELMNVFFYPVLCKDTKFCKRLQVLSNLFCKQADQQCTLRPKNRPATTTEIKNHLEKKWRRRRRRFQFLSSVVFLFSCSCSLLLGRVPDWLSRFSFVNLFKLLFDFSFFVKQLRDFNLL